MKELRIYRIKCEVLSPVHIGDGTEIEPFEYVVEDKFYKINLNEFLCSLSEDLQQQLKKLQNENDVVGVRKFIKENIDLKKFSEWEADVSGTVKNLYNKKFDQLQNQLLTIPFIRSGNDNRPYIPGSSIKGAIRTAILNKWSDYIVGEPKDKFKAQNVEAEILNALYGPDNRGKYKFDMDRDPFRALKIRDAFLPENSTLFCEVSNFNIDKSGNLHKTGIQIIAEVTKSALFGDAIEFELEIGIDQKLFDNSATKLQSRKIDIDLLLSSCNRFYSSVLESERRRLFDRRNANIASFYNTIKEKAEGGYLLRIGWGSGFESITLERFREPKEPRRGKGGWGYSKNLVESKYPLGWMKLELSSGKR